ncbi:hypothetical protein V8C43DRAFT_270666 [Trichoderma afarasin]
MAPSQLRGLYFWTLAMGVDSACVGASETRSGCSGEEAWSCVIRSCFNIAHSPIVVNLAHHCQLEVSGGNGHRRLKLPVVNCCNMPGNSGTGSGDQL